MVRFILFIYSISCVLAFVNTQALAEETLKIGILKPHKQIIPLIGDEVVNNLIIYSTSPFLLRLNPYGIPDLELAKAYFRNSDATRWSFILDKEQVNDSNRSLGPEQIRDSLRFLKSFVTRQITVTEKNSDLLNLLKENYSDAISSLRRIKSISLQSNKSSIAIELISPNFQFDKTISLFPIFNVQIAKQFQRSFMMGTNYTSCGKYIISENRSGENISLKRNKSSCLLFDYKLLPDQVLLNLISKNKPIDELKNEKINALYLNQDEDYDIKTHIKYINFNPRNYKNKLIKSPSFFMVKRNFARTIDRNFQVFYLKR